MYEREIGRAGAEASGGAGHGNVNFCPNASIRGGYIAGAGWRKYGLEEQHEWHPGLDRNDNAQIMSIANNLRPSFEPSTSKCIIEARLKVGERDVPSSRTLFLKGTTKARW